MSRQIFLNFPEMFLDTNVTDLLIGVTELIFEKNSKNCDIFAYLVLPLSEFFLFATRLTMCYNYSKT